jgi:transcriptional regulator with XRE-family HTH domain
MSKIENLIEDAISSIHYRRKVMKLSQSELAEKVGTSTVTISNIETLRNKPSNELLIKICKVLNIDI